MMMDTNRADSQFDYQRSGSHGIDNANWSDIAKVLFRFGARAERNTNREPNALWKFPNGKVVPIPVAVRGKAGRGGVSNVLRCIKEAGVPTILFLAALREQGVPFIQAPKDVTIIQRYLRERNPSLATPNEWRRAFSEAVRFVESGGKEQEKKQVQIVVPEKSYPYTIRQIVDSVTDDKKEARVFATRIASQLSGGYGLAERLRKAGEAKATGAHNTPNRYRFTESGAMRMAEWTEKAIQQELKKKAATERATEPAKEQDMADSQHAYKPEEQRRTIPPLPTPAEPNENIIRAVLKLCRDKGVQPVIDIEATLMRLADS